ncbi:MAG: hypothetical protein RBR59_08155 [Sulfurimonadaceae bacterium]|jgi:hypothetical protein|nr:hypothetical protein [Sulfurimonadaceae bacterium]
MIQLLYALMIGMLVTFIFDFFLFLGIYLHYIKYYEVDLYFNILFVDNQNLLLFGLSTIFYGFMVLFLKSNKVKLIFLIVSFLLVSLALLKDYGYLLGEKIFKQSKVTLQEKKYTYKGDIIYSGRTQILFYDYDLQKNITINKKDLIR